MAIELIFTRTQAAAEVIERCIAAATSSVEAALYRFSNPRLAAALYDAGRRGVSVRLVLNHNDHREENRAIRETLSNYGVAFRISHGRLGPGSKMHHKFAILDHSMVLTGSYNWTMESEERNYENVLGLDDPALVEAYTREFEALWAGAGKS